MAGQKHNLYISERDAELFDWIKRYAYKHRMPVNAVLLMAAEQLRERVESDKPDE